ncbi:MAG: hypothetical protein IJC88_01155 [Oscillospiraceae bacterium]|nr:hypothetical protein [Oscillospiraceae bacterium]
MKKLLAMLLAISMVLTLFACAPKHQNEDVAEPEIQEDVDSVIPEEEDPILPEDEVASESEEEDVAAPEEDAEIGNEEDTTAPPQPEDKPVEQKPVEQKPVEQKPVEQKPAVQQSTTQKPAEQKPAVQQSTTQKPVEQKPAVQQKPTTQKPAEQKPAVQQKPTTQKPVEQKPAVQQKPVEQEKPVEQQKPVEEEKPAETPAKSPAQTLRADFRSRVSSTKDPEALASALIGNSIIPFMGASMPVEPGFLNGFDNEISGFSKGAMFGPAIGTIPFIGYIFEVDANTDVSAFIQTLKDNANLRWNICTSADEMVVDSVGNTVFFLMAPAAFEE